MTRRLPIVPSAEAPRAQLVHDAPAAPPWDHLPTVEWQVCGQCNYDCSYCIQSKKYRVGYPTAQQLDRALTVLAELDGRWEVKMTGGEPFASRLFFDQIVPALVQTPHRISTLTNLSAPVRQLQWFAEQCGEKLGIVSASLHFEFTTTDQFLRSLTAMRDAAHAEASFVVNCVLAPAHLEAVARAQQQVQDAGFRFFPQLMKVKHGLFPYDDGQMEAVRNIVGDLSLATRLRTANMAPAYTGRLCWTGARYFVLLQSGDAWSCRSARRYDEGYLGNAYDGSLSLRTRPVRCAYPLCPCTVPANRGMIEGVERSPR
ncbi:MAG: radical SAM protein [Deltaproteobacteria bacterium]|nr:radical SAM protein [Deltaproteobacteria bacterium]